MHSEVSEIVMENGKQDEQNMASHIIRDKQGMEPQPWILPQEQHVESIKNVKL